MKKEENSRVAEIEVSYRPTVSDKPVITSSLDAFEELYKFFPHETISLQERMVAMYLNRANRVLGVYNLSVGGITGTVLDVRLLLSIGLKTAATGIILCHNHPSGKLDPSPQDLAITAKVREACSLVDIKLMDHFIISAERNYYSFSDQCLL